MRIFTGFDTFGAEPEAGVSISVMQREENAVNQKENDRKLCHCGIPCFFGTVLRK